MTPLSMACQIGNVPIIKILLRAGAQVERPTINHLLPLYIAAQEGFQDAVLCLMAAGANVNAVNGSGRSTALHVAAISHGYTEVAQILQEQGVHLS